MSKPCREGRAQPTEGRYSKLDNIYQYYFLAIVNILKCLIIYFLALVKIQRIHIFELNVL